MYLAYGGASAAVLETFAPHYRELIGLLPARFHPTSAKHGHHSYTLCLASSIPPSMFKT